MKTLLGYIAAFVLLTVAGCGHSYPPSLRLADSLMDSRPDSALAVLDAAREQTAGAPEAVRMRYQLLRHQAMNKAYVPFTTDSAMLAVADYYDRHGTANDRILAHYLLGCVYRDLGEAPKALSAYHDAVDCADTISYECDYALLCRIHGQAGELLYKQALFQSAISEYDKGFLFAQKCNEKITAINYYEQKAKCYYNMGYTDSLLSVCMNASKMYREYGDDKAANTCLGSVVFVCLQQKDYEAASKFLNLYEHHSYLSEKNIKAYDPWKLLYVYKGYYYLGIGKVDSASHHFRKVIGECKDLNTKLSAYRGMLNIYKSLGAADSLSKYAIEYCAISDSSVKLLNSTTIEHMQELYSYNHYQQDAERSMHKAETANMKTQIAILIIILLALATISGYLIMHYIHKGKFRLLTAQYGANMLLLSETVSHLTTLKKQSAALEEQISEKEREVSALRTCLAEYQTGNQLPDDWMPSDVIYDTAIMKTFHKLAVAGQTATDEHWNELRIKINEFMPDFVEKLLKSGATLDLKDTEICLLTKLRFSPGEQSILLNIKPSALSNRRARLLRKLFYEEGSSVVFEEKIRRL